MPLHGGTAFSKTWRNRNPNASVAWMERSFLFFSETVAKSVFSILFQKRWIQIFLFETKVRAEAWQMPKLKRKIWSRSWQSCNPLTKTSSGRLGSPLALLCIGIVVRHVRSCSDEEGEALGWLGTGKPRKIHIWLGRNDQIHRCHVHSFFVWLVIWRLDFQKYILGPGWSTLQATFVRPTARPQSKGSRIQ